MQDLTIEELYEDFDDLTNSGERMDDLPDLGLGLPELPDEAETEEKQVHGCMSNV